MPHSKLIYFLCFFIFFIFLFYGFLPQDSPAQELKLLADSREDSKQSDFLNPREQLQIALKENEFHNCICFRSCHKKANLSPENKTIAQWNFLIKENGHAIFAQIPWKNSTQKNKILQYLKQNAKDAKQNSEGIGVWN